MPSYYLLLANGMSVRPDSVLSLKHYENQVIFKLTNGDTVYDVYPSNTQARNAKNNFLIQIEQFTQYQLAGTPNLGAPRLVAIIPNLITSNDLWKPNGTLISAYGENFDTSYQVVFEGSDVAALQNLIGTTQLWQRQVGAIPTLFTEGTFDAVLLDGSSNEMDRMVNAFQVYPPAAFVGPNDDFWDLTKTAPISETPTYVGLTCFFHGSTDTVNYDTLYSWDPNSSTWVGIITV